MSQAPVQLRGPFCNSAGCYLEIPELFQTESKLTLCCCYCSIAKSCLTLRPYGLQHARLPCPSQTEFVLPEFVQIHVHCVGDVIQPSHPLSPTSPPALSLSQHQDLFQRVGSLHQVAKGLQLQLQHQSFQ